METLNKNEKFETPYPRGIDFSEEEVTQALNRNEMLMLVLYTSKVCNFKCPYCYVSHWNEEGSPLSILDYKDIIVRGMEIGVKSIWWVGKGEPFLYENWKELIDYITSKNLWIGIFTNGSLITKEVARFVNKRNVSLYVKMNSFYPQIQDELVGGINGAYKKIQRSIENLLEVGFNSRNRFAIETVITRLNYSEIPRIFRWARKNGIIPFIEMMEYANEYARNLDVSLEEHKDLFYKLLDIDQREFGYSWIPFPPWVALRCRNLYFSIAVDNEGYVQPCSGLRVKIGNIRDESLKYWWNTSALKKFRNPDNVEPHYCEACSLGNYGCKSHAYHVTGNPFALDERISIFWRYYCE